MLHFTLATFKPWDWWSGWIMGNTSAQWQALRARLPPSSEGVAGGQTSHHQLAALLLAAAPLVLAAVLVQRYLWHQGLGLFLHCCRCRVQRALTPAQPRHSRSGSGGSGGGTSPQSPCGDAELQQLLEPVAAVAGIVSVPAWLTAAAASAGVAALLVSMGSATLLLIPRQVSCGGRGVQANRMCKTSAFLGPIKGVVRTLCVACLGPQPAARMRPKSGMDSSCCRSCLPWAGCSLTSARRSAWWRSTRPF